MPYSDLERSLTNHPPQNDAVLESFEALREQAKNYGKTIHAYVPNSREKSIAITKLEESLMWAIKAVALNQWDQS